MSPAQTYPALRQVFTIGRGVEPQGGVVYDSPTSGDSYDRGAMTAQYALAHADTVESVHLSGAYTFVLDAEGDIPVGYEADGMLDIAITDGLPGHIQTSVDTKAKTTYQNFTEAVGKFNDGDAVALVVHRDHARRALKVGRKVMPNVTFVPIYADDPQRSNKNTSAKGRDLLAGLLYGVAMAPIRAGNIEAIRRRDQQVQNLVIGGLRLAAKLRSPKTGNDRHI